MINLIEKTITLNGIEEEIIRFEVWWRTPFGLTSWLEEALEKVAEFDNPQLMIAPVVTAIGNGGNYETL